MKKEDLKYGNVVETIEGNRYILTMADGTSQFIQLNRVSKCAVKYFNMKDITDDLKGLDEELYTIVKVYEDYTCTKLLWERKEKLKIVLTEDGKTILRNLPKKFKYIARDKYGDLWIYEYPVEKNKNTWCIPIEYGDADMIEITVFSHLFQFIKWEDENAYSIEDLLND